MDNNNTIYYIKKSSNLVNVNDDRIESSNNSTTNIDDAILFEILNKDQLPSNVNIESKNPQGLFLKVKDEDYYLKIHVFRIIGLLAYNLINLDRTNEWHSYIIPGYQFSEPETLHEPEYEPE